MKCPRCGAEMVMDSHRKIDQMMCYQCGYIEGRRLEGEENNDADDVKIKNFEHLQHLNYNEAVAFLAEGMHIDLNQLSDWLQAEFKA